MKNESGPRIFLGLAGSSKRAGVSGGVGGQGEGGGERGGMEDWKKGKMHSSEMLGY